MAEDTSSAVLEPSPEAEAAPVDELETVANATEGDEPNAETQETVAETVPLTEVEERVKAAIAEREAEWEAQQHRDNYKREQTAAEHELQNATFAKVDGLVGWIAKQLDDGKTVAEIQQIRNPLVLKNIAEPLAAAVFSQQWEAQRTHFDDYVKKAYPDWKPSQAAAKQLEQAVVSRDPARLVRAHWDYLADAIKSVEVPKGVDAALKAEKDKAKPAKAVLKEQEADERRAATPRPTTGGGGAAGAVVTSMNDADRAYNRGEISGEQYAKYAQQYGVRL